MRIQRAFFSNRSWVRLLPMLAAGLSAPATRANGPYEISLDGPWAFRLCPSDRTPEQSEFFRPDFNASGWAAIRVPGNWELEGFEEPVYDRPTGTVGLYRRHVTVPKDWTGRRLLIRFEGVLYAFQCWINGRPVGSHESAFTPCQFDVTDVIRSDRDNLLAVRVYKRYPGHQLDCFDDWALSGIFRDVTLIALPQTYLADLWTHASIANKTYLTIEGSVFAPTDEPAPQDLTVTCTLTDPNGQTVNTAESPVAIPAKVFTCRIPIERPRLWTAESPSLYSLKADLRREGQTLHSLTRPVGLREVKVERGVLKLNGAPVKLRGVNMHEIRPDVGRALTDEHRRRDVELMKAANINAVRTSHNPTHPRFLDLCDREGLYVICEVPINSANSILRDPNYQDRLFTRAEETVLPNRHHPCVILWSVGNENIYTPLVGDTVKRVKVLDPTRPVCIPQGFGDFVREGFSLPDGVDILAPHYPSPQQLVHFAQKSRRPLLCTEYAHALGKAFEGIGECWEIMQRYPNLAGGAIWHWCDQSLYRKALPGEFEQFLKNPTEGLVWVSKDRYMDSCGNKGTDGIVYGDRQPQVDYWRTRKAYSPIRVEQREVSLRPGPPQITLNVSNRSDFTNLHALRGCWELYRNAGRIAEGDLPMPNIRPTTSGKLPLNVTLPADITHDDYRLILRFADAKRAPVHEHPVRIRPVAGRVPYVEQLSQARRPGGMQVKQTDTRLEVLLSDSRVDVDTRAGWLSLWSPAKSGTPILRGPTVRVGRRPTMGERRVRERSYPNKESFWEPYLLEKPVQVAVTTRTSDKDVQVLVSARYARVDKPGQFIDAKMSFAISPCGWIDVEYALTPRNATGILLEAGLSFHLPGSLATVYWLGNGPDPSYPGSDEASERGLYALKASDLWFPGNRSGVDLAAIADANRSGIGLVCDSANIVWERSSDGIVFGHNAAVSGRGTKGMPTNHAFAVDLKKPIQGRFRIIPLVGGQWPEPFQRTFKDVRPSPEYAGPAYLADYD